MEQDTATLPVESTGIAGSSGATRSNVLRTPARSIRQQATLRLKPNATFNIECDTAASRFDCRLVFMGENYRRVTRAYIEAVHCFSHCTDDESLYASLTACPDIVNFYDVTRRHGEVAIEMRETAFSHPGPHHSTHLRAAFRHGRRALSEDLPVERLGALGQLLPLLLGDYDESQIISTLHARLEGENLEWACELFSRLRQNDLLENGPAPPNSLLDRAQRPRVTFLGHTSLLFQSPHAAIVMDPLSMPELGHPAAFRDVARLPLRGICCTHNHWDHCDFQTLLWFPKDVPVFVPKIKHANVLNPPMVEALRSLGFHDIREVTHWDPVRIDDIEFIPTPFHGEQDEPGAEIDHYTYVVRSGELTVYGGVDCFRDTLGEMTGVLEKVRELYQPQIAFLPVSRMVYSFAGGSVNGFCRYLDSHLLTQTFQYTASADDAAEWVRLLGAPYAAPYATFTFSRWHSPAEVSRFRRALKSRGLGDCFYPFSSMDGVSLSDLDGSFLARIRRGWAVTLCRARVALQQLDRKLQRVQVYRLLRRMLKSPGAETAHHH
jgi:L-ascorbate metabolism protein UlaG (beta-lactamase superfamily)